MGKCLFLRKGEIYTSPITFDPEFANNTWDQVIETCQKNRVPDSWEVGDQKAMIIGDTEYMIDIIGKYHDIYSDGSGVAPLTFQLHDLYPTTYIKNSNRSYAGWDNSDIRKILSYSIFNLLPDEVQIGIKKVEKPTTTSYGDNSLTVTTDALFLLSAGEVFGSEYIPIINAIDGVQYEYYLNSNNRKKTINNSLQNMEWWTRSPSQYRKGMSYAVNTEIVSLYVNYYSYISFAFCF